MRPLALSSLIGLCLAATPALADSPRTMMLELHGGAYAPDVDSELSGATPWKDTFGAGSMTMLRMHLDYELWQEHGTVAIGAGFGYGWIDGNARNEEGDKTDDKVGFNLMPLQLSLVYRWDWAAVEHGVPLVPYGKVGLTGAIWWATDAKDNISNTRVGDAAREGQGLTLGWHAAVGVMFLLGLGLVEVALALWVLSGILPVPCAIAQTVLLVALNANGLAWARHIIHDPAGMVVKNIAFLTLAWVAASLP